MSSEKTTSRSVEGRDYANQTAVMLAGMVDGVEASTDAARQISLSNQQQQIASDQVVLAIRDIEQGVRHSTDSIQKMNLVTVELAELSSKLKALVAKFLLAEVAGSRATES